MASSPRRIILKSIDGETFEVDEAVALQMQTIKELVEKDSADIFLPVENVKGGILSKVIGYCRMHADDHATDDQLESFDAQFVNVEQEVLFDLILLPVNEEPNRSLHPTGHPDHFVKKRGSGSQCLSQTKKAHHHLLASSTSFGKLFQWVFSSNNG